MSDVKRGGYYALVLLTALNILNYADVRLMMDDVCVIERVILNIQ
jgi:hypothetical protein